MKRTVQQYHVDSEGRLPDMPAGTRVAVGPLGGKEGTVRIQKLHYDCGESFFGNVVVDMDDGASVEAHCWQCMKVANSQNDD